MCFNSNHPTVWVEKSKIGFQDGGYGVHFGFPIGMILAIFHLHMKLLLHCKFQLNLHCDLRDVHLRFRINMSLAHFDPEVVLLLQSKFLLKSTKGLGRDVEK